MVQSRDGDSCSTTVTSLGFFLQAGGLLKDVLLHSGWFQSYCCLLTLHLAAKNGRGMASLMLKQGWASNAGLPLHGIINLTILQTKCYSFKNSKPHHGHLTVTAATSHHKDFGYWIFCSNDAVRWAGAPGTTAAYHWDPLGEEAPPACETVQ